MSIFTRAFNILVCLFFTVGLTNCGGGSTKSQKVEITSYPEESIVITGSTKDSLEQDVAGPWFSFTVRISNPTDQDLTIVAFSIEVTASGSSGQIETRKVSFSPTLWNRTLPSTVECKYTTFGTWAPGESKAIELRNGIAACDLPPGFFIGGNPTGPSGKNFRYRVKIKPEGWFGDAEDRFEHFVTIFTR